MIEKNIILIILFAFIIFILFNQIKMIDINNQNCLNNSNDKNLENFYSNYGNYKHYCTDCGCRMRNNCSECRNCGYCISDDGFGKCVPGDYWGPHYKKNCKYWEYGDPYYYYPRNNLLIPKNIDIYPHYQYNIRKKKLKKYKKPSF